MSEPLLALVGPTASGKTEAGIQIAERLGAEIVSVDSMLVYRGMDIGTAKPTEADRARVPHHLIDVADPREPFTVQRFQWLARTAIDAIRERGSTPLLVGGSGLYLRAVADDLEFPRTDDRTRRELERSATVLGAERLHARLADLDPAAASKIEPANLRRTIRALEVAAITGRPFSEFAAAWDHYPEERLHAAGIEMARPELAARIGARVDAMIVGGLIDEVEGLVRDGFGDWLTATQAIGYAEITRHLAGELTIEEAAAATVKRTRNLARRQMAWFAKDPRVRWIAVGTGGATTAVDTLQGMLTAATLGGSAR